MESQVTFNVLMALCGTLCGWLLKVIWDAIQDLKKEIRDINKEIHQDFVRKEDFSEAISRIESMCTRIFDKLDNKADK